MGYCSDGKPMNDRNWRERECKDNGGHCYEIQDDWSNQNLYCYLRVCKHCGHGQHGVKQPSIKWSDLHST